MIPKIVHYVWVGPKALPAADAARIERWQELLPDWEIRRWGNDEIDFSHDYPRMAFAVRAWNRVSDYVRMEALATHGGVYLDTDVDLVRSLDPLLGHPAFLGFQAGDELPGEIVNGAVFGAEPGHWLPVHLRDHFDNELDGRDDLDSFTGPGLLTKVLRERGLERASDEPVTVDGVVLYPRRWFYPYSWTETYTPDVITDDTVAVHRWAETWVVKQPSKYKELRRKVVNRLARYTPRLAFLLTRLVATVGSRRSA